nr:nonaspanin [Tanacetum cinerariifolium]
MELAIAKCLNSSEYLSALGAAIGKAIEKGMQDGLAAGITHGKEGRVLADVATYNPSAKVDYVSALQQLQSVNFSLLTELKLNKDSSVETLMNIICLEETLAERLDLNELQPHVDQLMVPIHHSPNQTVVGATALSLFLDVSHARVQKVRENISNYRSALRDVFIPLVEPFSTVALEGTGGTSNTEPVTIDTTTALSMVVASTSTVRPIFIDDYEVAGMDDQATADGNVVDEDANPFLNVDDAELNVPE